MASVSFLSGDTIRPPIVRPVPPAYDVQLDEVNRLVRTVTRGVWTLDVTEDYLAELTDLVDECRRRFGRARVLVDRRATPVLPEAVLERLGQSNAAMFVESDRLAVVVDSSLAKGQMRRRFTNPGSQAFLSYTAAELWLTAWP